MSFTLIAIDLISTIFFKNFYIFSKYTFNQTLTTIILSIIISFTTKRFRYILSISLITITLIEITFFSFFRTRIQSYHYEVIFSEIDDILDSLISILPTLIVVGVVYLLLSIFIYRVSSRIKGGYLSINIFITITLASLPIYSTHKPLNISALNFSYLNMLYSFSNFMGTLLNIKSYKFKPYRVERSQIREENIIVVVGESLSSKRMGLFGYSIDNTPNLNRLRGNPKFYYEEILSGGVNTPVSIVTFFTLKREPQNSKLLLKPDTNLLYLANRRGFNTYWFSMQSEGMSISSILEYAKRVKLRGDYPKGSFDEVLIDELKDIDWSRKNFIILHFRANHSPYEKYIPKSFRVSDYNRLDYHKYKVNSYSDSVKYIDYLLDKIFRFIDRSSRDIKLYYISDHGERLGYADDNYKYGHSELSFEVAKTPLLIYSNRKLNIEGRFKNHYIVGKEILRDLGYTLINPNNSSSTYYINGLNISGRGGFLKYNIKSRERKRRTD